jgi:hypothetical protein
MSLLRKQVRRGRVDWVIAVAIIVAGLMVSASIFVTSKWQVPAADSTQNLATPASGESQTLLLKVPSECSPEELREVLERWEQIWEQELPVNDESPFRVHGGVI